MKVPSARGSAATADILGSPAIMVILVIIFGAIIYLWRAGYMRPRTCFWIAVVLMAAVVFLGLQMYSAGGGTAAG
jgi:hypothetical protein